MITRHPHRRRALAVALLLALTACTQSSTDDTPAEQQSAAADGLSMRAEDPSDVCTEDRVGGSLNFRTVSEGSGTDPAVSQSNMTTNAAIYGTLLRYNNATGEFEGDLAESLTGNQDSSQWTLTLRDDVRYSDGTLLDAAAVKQNLERYVDPNFPSAFTSRVAEISEMTIKDPRTVVFDLKSSWGTFPWLLAQSPGMVVNPKVLASTEPEELAAGAPENAGAGAYVFSEAVRGESVTFAAKSDWWGGPVCIEELTLSWGVNDSSADYDAQRAGQVQAFFTYDTSVLKRADADPEADIYQLPEAIGSYVTGNARQEPFSDIRMRQAVAMSLDRDLINSRIYNGMAYATAAVVPPSLSDQPTVEPVQFDPEAAEQLAKELKDDGATTAFEYLVTPNPAIENQVILEQALTKNAGLDMQIEYLQIPDYVERIFGSRNFVAANGGISISGACPYCALDQFTSKSSQNVTGFSSPALDEALDTLKAALPGEQTVSALDELQTVWNKEMPSVPTIWIPQYIVADTSVRGLGFSASSYQIHFDAAYVDE